MVYVSPTVNYVHWCFFSTTVMSSDIYSFLWVLELNGVLYALQLCFLCFFCSTVMSSDIHSVL